MRTIKLNSYGINFVIFMMSSNKSNIYNAMLVIYRDNKTVLVSFDVKNDTIIGKYTCIFIYLLDIRWRYPNRLSGVVIPCFKNISHFCMSFPKISQHFLGNYSHCQHKFINMLIFFTMPFFTGNMTCVEDDYA